MEKMPDGRFANAGEMLAALHAIPQPAAWLRGAAPAAAVHARGASVPAMPQAARSGLPVALIVGAVAGLALLGVLALGAAFFLLR
jgi:hypothetical protein